jgi:hypothetical protein
VRRRDILLHCLLQVLLGRIEFLFQESDFAAESIVGDFAVFRIRQGGLLFGQCRLRLLEFAVENAKSVVE